jgi:hypothetical protein
MNIYQFPRQSLSASTPIDPTNIALNTRQGSKHTKSIAGWKKIMPWTIGLVWLFLGLFWPLLNWLAAMDVVFQILRALYYSNIPEIHATLQASIHGILYILLSLFVYLYRPKAF